VRTVIALEERHDKMRLIRRTPRLHAPKRDALSMAHRNTRRLRSRATQESLFYIQM